jgi:mannose-6-phosphate isomerase-like protein (cupin superfamily)
MTTELQIQHGTNFSIAHAGEWKGLRGFFFHHPVLGKVPGKLFLKEPLQMSALEISLGVLAAGRGMPFLHAHRQNEEVYIFVRGRGQFQVDGEVLEIREGTVIRVSPAGVRAWRNTSTEDLYYIVIQAKAGTLSTGTITDGRSVPGTPQWKEAEGN